MIRLKRIEVDADRLNKIRKRLRISSNTRVLNQLPLQKYGDWVLRRLIKLSPDRANTNKSEWLSYIRGGGSSDGPWADSMMIRFAKGWTGATVKTSLNQTGKVGIDLEHELLEPGQDETFKSRYRAIMFGRSSGSYVAPRNFRFMRSKKEWFRFIGGKTYSLPAQEGASKEIMSKLEMYVNSWIAQNVRRDLDKLIRL